MSVRMRAGRVDKRGLAWFLGLTFSISWLIMAAIWLTGGPSDTGAVYTGVIVAMWIPGLCALLVSRYVTRETSLGSGVRQIRVGRYHLWAWLLPVLFALSSTILTPLLRAGDLDLSVTPVRVAIEEAAAQEGSAAVPSLQTVLAVQLAFSLFGAPLIGLFVALGEELGWRGYLLRKLLPLGQWNALLLSGAIWGLWHAPLVGLRQNYPGHPISGPFLMLGYCVLLGVVLGWLQLASGSVWVPALAHGTLNAVNGLPLLFVSNVDRAIGGPPNSLVGWIGIAACVAWLLLSGRLPVPMRASEPTPQSLSTSSSSQ